MLSLGRSSVLLLFMTLVLEVLDASVLAEPVSTPEIQPLAGGVDDAYCVDTHQFEEKDNVYEAYGVLRSSVKHTYCKADHSVIERNEHRLVHNLHPVIERGLFASPIQYDAELDKSQA